MLLFARKSPEKVFFIFHKFTSSSRQSNRAKIDYGSRKPSVLPNFGSTYVELTLAYVPSHFKNIHACQQLLDIEQMTTISHFHSHFIQTVTRRFNSPADDASSHLALSKMGHVEFSHIVFPAKQSGHKIMHLKTTYQ